MKVTEIPEYALRALQNLDSEISDDIYIANTELEKTLHSKIASLRMHLAYQNAIATAAFAVLNTLHPGMTDEIEWSGPIETETKLLLRKYAP